MYMPYSASVTVSVADIVEQCRGCQYNNSAENSSISNWQKLT